jgi:hypothetical protein
MLIKPKAKEEIKRAIEGGRVEEIFNPQERVISPKSRIIIQPSPTDKLVPLTDKDGNALHFGIGAELDLWAAIDRCIEAKKIPANIKEACEYVEKNKSQGYEDYLTGGLIAYSQEYIRDGQEIIYEEDKKRYLFRVPYGFGDLKKGKALLLFFDFFDDGTPYFQRIQSRFNGKPIDEIVINRAGELIISGKIIAIEIPLRSGYFLADPNTFIPNRKASIYDPDVNYFHIGYDYDYVGLMRVEKYKPDRKSAISADSLALNYRSIMLVHE